ncbi:hypothetical protein Tco_0298845 [Tanacetum coccineum]
MNHGHTTVKTTKRTTNRFGAKISCNRQSAKDIHQKGAIRKKERQVTKEKVPKRLSTKTEATTPDRNSQVKDNKIDLLVKKYEQFVISKDESIDNAFARFNTIVISLKALDEGYSSKNYVRKFLWALRPKWRPKVMTIEESKDLTSLSFDELNRNLKVYEMIIKKDFEIVKAKGERKSLALKTKKESSDEESLTSGSEDEEYVMAVRDFKKFFKKRVRCRNTNNLIRECPKPPKDKNQRAFHQRFWSDNGEEDDEKAKDKMYLVAQASNEICLGVDLEPNEWIKDSGCSKHMTGNRKLFSTYKAYNGGHSLHFDHSEFALISGFPFGTVNFGLYIFGELKFRNRVFPHKLGLSVTNLDIIGVIEDEETFRKLCDQDSIRLCLILALEIIFMGRLTGPVDDTLFQLVENLEDWNCFPWGEHICTHLYDKIKNVIENNNDEHYFGMKKDRMYVPTYTLSGFVFAFQVNHC